MHRLSSSLSRGSLAGVAVSIFAGDNKAPADIRQNDAQTRLLVMRDLTAERVFVRIRVPARRHRTEIKNGKITPSDQQVASLVAEHGFAAKPGDRVIITNVEFKEKSIVLEINGGGKKKQKWYQHVSLGAGGTTAPVGGGAPQSLEANGSTVTLAFDKYVPEMTGEQVRQLLAPVFDFKALTEAEAYEKTLPPKVQAAIKDHKVLVGMDRDMVIYAKGRPPKKIRDKDDERRGLRRMDLWRSAAGGPVRPLHRGFRDAAGDHDGRWREDRADPARSRVAVRRDAGGRQEAGAQTGQCSYPAPAGRSTRDSSKAESGPADAISASGGTTAPAGAPGGTPPHWQFAELTAELVRPALGYLAHASPAPLH